MLITYTFGGLILIVQVDEFSPPIFKAIPGHIVVALHKQWARAPGGWEGEDDEESGSNQWRSS